MKYYMLLWKNGKKIIYEKIIPNLIYNKYPNLVKKHNINYDLQLLFNEK